MLARVLIVWLYNNAGRSVFAARLFHAMLNARSVTLPNYGLPYNPFTASLVTAATVGIVVVAWGPRALGGYRYRWNG